MAMDMTPDAGDRRTASAGDGAPVATITAWVQDLEGLFGDPETIAEKVRDLIDPATNKMTAFKDITEEQLRMGLMSIPRFGLANASKIVTALREYDRTWPPPTYVPLSPNDPSLHHRVCRRCCPSLSPLIFFGPRLIPPSSSLSSIPSSWTFSTAPLVILGRCVAAFPALRVVVGRAALCALSDAATPSSNFLVRILTH